MNWHAFRNNIRVKFGHSQPCTWLLKRGSNKGKQDRLKKVKKTYATQVARKGRGNSKLK